MITHNNSFEFYEQFMRVINFLTYCVYFHLHTWVCLILHWANTNKLPMDGFWKSLNWWVSWIYVPLHNLKKHEICVTYRLKQGKKDGIIIKRLRCLFYRLVTSVRQRKKVPSPHEEPNLRISDFALWCSATTQPNVCSRWWIKLFWLRGSCVSRIQHTVRIGNVESVMRVNRIRKMANFLAVRSP